MTDVKTSIDLDAWQIGSSVPPAMCLCCGSKFDDSLHKRRGPYLEMPYIWVCQWCWEKPYLFFPDKPFMQNVPERSQSDTISTPAVSPRGGILRLSIVPERPLSAKQAYKRVADLKLNPRNPRLRHLGKFETEDEVERALWKEPSTRVLYKEIEYTQGLSNPLWIDEAGVVREGNRRLVCLKKLIDKIKAGETDVPLFKVRRVPCYVLPKDAKEEDIALYVTLEHVIGKKEWRPVNQAAQIFDLHNAYELSFARIADIVGRPQSTLKVMEKAYKATLQYHEWYPSDSGWMSKYSYFFEAYRHRQTSEWASVKGNLRRLARWIYRGKISKGAEVRKLPLIIGDVESNDMRNLSEEQKDADRRLISLTRQTREIISNLSTLRKQGRLTKEALQAIQDLQVELTKFIGQSSSDDKATS